MNLLVTDYVGTRLLADANSEIDSFLGVSRYDFDRPEMLHFLPQSAEAVLDVGCNTGRFGALLRRRNSSVRLVGIELDPSAAQEAEKIFDQVVSGTFPLAAGRVHRSGGYDAIVFNDVLEHMADPEDALEAARKLLAPDGVLVASIPNVRHITATGPLVLRGEWRYRDTGILDSTQLRFYTDKSIRRLFADNDWEVVRLEPLNRCFRITDPSPRWWIRILGWVTRGFTDPFFVLQYGVTARRVAPKRYQE